MLHTSGPEFMTLPENQFTSVSLYFSFFYILNYISGVHHFGVRFLHMRPGFLLLLLLLVCFLGLFWVFCFVLFCFVFVFGVFFGGGFGGGVGGGGFNDRGSHSPVFMDGACWVCFCCRHSPV